MSTLRFVDAKVFTGTGEADFATAFRVDDGDSGQVEGFGFDESGDPDGRRATRQDLDAVSAGRPVLVRRRDNPSVVFNGVVVLERDAFRMPPPEIDRVRVQETWTRVERVFRR